MFVLFFMPEMKAMTYKSQSSSCLSVSQRFIYISVWMLGLTALVTAMSNFKPKDYTKNGVSTTHRFFPWIPASLGCNTADPRCIFCWEGSPSPVAGKTLIIETKRGGWASLFRQHLAYSPLSTAGFLSAYSFKLS